SHTPPACWTRPCAVCPPSSSWAVRASDQEGLALGDDDRGAPEAGPGSVQQDRALAAEHTHLPGGFTGLVGGGGRGRDDAGPARTGLARATLVHAHLQHPWLDPGVDLDV